MAQRRGQTVAAAVLPFPGRRARSAVGRARFVPSTRSFLAGLLVALAAGGLYLAARHTSMFALRTIEVRGAEPAVAMRVRAALEALLGSSLVSFDRDRADRLVFQVAQVASASFDRDFPHNLLVSVRAERPVALLRQARDAWLVSARGRVLRRLESRPYAALPRIWVPRSLELSVNTTVGGVTAGAVQAATAAGAARLPESVRSLRTVEGSLTLTLASGTEIRLGEPGDARLKLAVARRILPLVPDAEYVDVSVPARVVVVVNSQLSG